MFNIRILIILTFFSSIGFSQIKEYPREHVSNYDLIGNVKTMIEDKTEEIYISNDKTALNRNINTYTFNKSDLLLTHYLKNNDGFEFLTEKNQYDVDNRLIYNIDQSRSDTIINNKKVRTKNLQKYETKYNYNDFGKLTTTFQKRYDNADFYMIELCTYSDSLLVEEISINNNIPFMYSDSFFRNTLTKYFYNSEGLLVNRKEFHDKKSNYYVSDSKGFNIIKPISIKDVDYSKFTLRTETFFKYNNKRQQISSKSITHDKEYYYGLDLEKLTEYFGTNKKLISFVDKGVIYQTLYNYAIINNDTLVASIWYKSNYEKENLKKERKVLNIIYNEDGSLKKKLYYNSDEKLEKSVFYDVKNKIVQIKYHELNTLSKTYYAYDNSGNLTFKKIESENSCGEISSILTLKYDIQGNWIYEELIDVPSGKIERLVKRNISYHQ